MELVDLVESQILADFMSDDLLGQYNPDIRDDPYMSEGEDLGDPHPYSISIASEDRGDFKGLPGTGVKLVRVEIQIDYNVGADGERQSRSQTLAQLAERAADRLVTTVYDTQQSRDVLNRLSNSKLRIYMISADETEKRSDLDLTRTRIITRELVCAQIA